MVSVWIRITVLINLSLDRISYFSLINVSIHYLLNFFRVLANLLQSLGGDLGNFFRVLAWRPSWKHVYLLGKTGISGFQYGRR